MKMMLLAGFICCLTACSQSKQAIYFVTSNQKETKAQSSKEERKRFEILCAAPQGKTSDLTSSKISKLLKHPRSW